MVTAENDGTIVIEKPILVPSRQKKLYALQDYLRKNWEFTDDPIEFINAHYHGDSERWIPEKSLRQLWGFLKDKWIDYASEDGLHKFMKDLWFTFKDHRVQTETWKSSLISWAQNSERLESNVTMFRAALMNIVGTKIIEVSPISSFSIDTYESLEFPIDKILYLLKIDKKSLWQIHTITWLGAQALMTAINTIVSEIVERIKTDSAYDIIVPKISKWSINNLLLKLQ